MGECLVLRRIREKLSALRLSAGDLPEVSVRNSWPKPRTFTGHIFLASSVVFGMYRC